MTLTADIQPSIETPEVLPNLDKLGQDALFTAARPAHSPKSSPAPPVSDEELRAIWELAKWPPTAANLQPLRVLFVRPGQGRGRLGSHMNEGHKAKTAPAPAVAGLARDTRFHEHVPTVLPFRPEMADMLEADEET